FWRTVRHRAWFRVCVRRGADRRARRRVARTGVDAGALFAADGIGRDCCKTVAARGGGRQDLIQIGRTSMCGILGVVATSSVNYLPYPCLQVLQHRGQDAAGIATSEAAHFHMHKGSGLVRDVFRTRNMRDLKGNWGIGHVRYPTAGSAYNAAEAQPFYVNSPFGLLLAHNGNLTNSEALKREMFLSDLRHINTSSDSEVLLNVLAHELQAACKGLKLDEEAIFRAVAGVHRRCRGAYAVVVMIAGFGLLAFRDPYGIRPLVIGRNDTAAGTEWLVASESVALDVLGFRLLRDVAP